MLKLLKGLVETFKDGKKKRHFYFIPLLETY